MSSPKRLNNVMEALLIIAQIGNSPKVNKSITTNYGSFL